MSRNKLFTLSLPILFFAFMILISSVKASSDLTLYFRSDVHTINGITGYRLAEASSSTGTYIKDTIYGLYSTSYGVRVWVVDEDGDLFELTDGEPVAVVTRDDGEGLQSATWDCPGYNDIVNALMIKVYHRFSTFSWVLRATFITFNETLIKLPASTWTFHYYTAIQYSGSYTYSYLYLGADYGTRVELQYSEPTPYELMMWKLSQRDIFGFIMLPFTYWLGFMAYGLVFLLPLGIGLYKIFDDFKATILGLLLIGGGTGGLISMLIPQSGLQLSWILFVLGIAGILWSLVKGK